MQTILGRNDYLIKYLRNEFKEVNQEVNIIVSFLKVSGLNLIIDDIQACLDRGIKVNILTCSYLGITESNALRLLDNRFGSHELFGLRLFVSNISFHPKCYMFKSKDKVVAFLGSSNISKTALTEGIEWNCSFNSVNHQDQIDALVNEFNYLYEKSHSITLELIRDYYQLIEKDKKSNNIGGNSFTKKYGVKLDKDHKQDVIDNLIASIPTPIIEPKPEQLHALLNLIEVRKESNKSLVVAATGLGKTYLAAFDVKHMIETQNYNKVLFIAHTDSILNQARESFVRVIPNKSTGLYTGKVKEEQADILFSTIQTLSKNYDYFDFDYFDYIVVDEFHHAAANSYQVIFDYFVPKFLLGLTATPERMDRADILGLCDHNIAYELRLHDAINFGLLAPFKYLGIYDPTDYKNVDYRNKEYNKKQLLQEFNRVKRSDLVLKHYQTYQGNCAVGFCVSIDHATEMCEYFNENGISAYVSHSRGSDSRYFLEKNEAINYLNARRADIVFTVDLFNEGVDIPEVDLLLFLRPTESTTIFLQQLGRGLRKTKDKTLVTVLDFIGNYETIDFVPRLFMNSDSLNNFSMTQLIKAMPNGCMINFDFQVVELLEKMKKAQQTKTQSVVNLIEAVNESWLTIEEKTFEKHPSRLELYRYSLDSNIDISRGYPTHNNLGYYNNLDMISDQEKTLLTPEIISILKYLEDTSMSKLYKIAVLLAFYNNGAFKTTVTYEDLVKSFYRFYLDKNNYLDFVGEKQAKPLEEWTSSYYKRIISKPVKFLKDSSNGVFTGDINEFKINLPFDEMPQIFIDHFLDIIHYRREQFFKNRLEKRGNRLDGLL